MKCLLIGLGAVLISFCIAGNASAQNPGQYQAPYQAQNQYQGQYQAPYQAQNQYPTQQGSYGNCDGCDGKKCGSCSNWFHLTGGCHGCCNNCPSIWRCLKNACCSEAPTIRPNMPLGFRTHPYARSPRDYFMENDP